MNAITRLLLVEHIPGDLHFLRRIFNEPGAPDTAFTHVKGMGDAETYLAKHAVDIILLDLELPDAQGSEAVRRAQAAAPGIPLVVLTGLDGELLAVQALQQGAQDYLIKGQIETRALLRALRYAVERKTMENAAQSMARQIAYSAEHDFLTGLPNRMFLNDRVGQAISLAKRNGKKVAVLFLDLDGFKHINDLLGHAIGDKLLQSVAKRLVDCIRGSDTVSRQGGDEFVILLLELEHAEDAAITAKRMLQAVAEGHAVDQHELHVTASIGVSVYPDDGLDPDALIKNADTAMYQAKENGRQSFQFFKPAMNARAVERQSIRGKSATRPGAAGIRAALPAEDRLKNRNDHGRGSVDSLDPSGSRNDLSGTIHSRRGRMRPDFAHWPLGSSRSVQASPGLDGRGSALSDHSHEHFRDGIPGRELSERLFTRFLERHGPGSEIARAGADRKRSDEACRIHGDPPQDTESKRRHSWPSTTSARVTRA